MPLPVLVLLFLLIPVAELYVIYKVGDSIGIGWTFLLLAADSVLGSLLLRSQGRTVWRRFNEALANGRMPHREVQDGVAVIFGGAFLITPGFLTDVVGLALLVPPTRALIVRLAGRVMARRMAAHAQAERGRRGGGEGYGADERRRREGGTGHDVEGSATEQPRAGSQRLER